MISTKAYLKSIILELAKGVKSSFIISLSKVAMIKFDLHIDSSLKFKTFLADRPSLIFLIKKMCNSFFVWWNKLFAKNTSVWPIIDIELVSEHPISPFL